MGAFLGCIENTATGTHLPQQLPFLHHQQILLKLVQIPLGIHIVNFWKNSGNIGIILADSILIPHRALAVGHIGETEDTIVKRGQLSAKILVPGGIPPICADPPPPVQLFQVFLRQRQGQR